MVCNAQDFSLYLHRSRPFHRKERFSTRLELANCAFFARKLDLIHSAMVNPYSSLLFSLPAHLTSGIVDQGALVANGQPLDLDFSRGDYDPNGLQEEYCNYKYGASCDLVDAYKLPPLNSYADYQSTDEGNQNLVGGQPSHGVVQDTNGAPWVRYSVPMSFPQTLPSRTVTKGSEWGGSHSVTNTEYEEHTISESTTNQFSELWSDATALDTSHSADMRFTYNIINNGTEYAREVSSLIFNIYLGNDPNPIHTFVAVGDNGQISQIENIFPGDFLQFTSNPIALTLDQMRAIDEGTSIRVVMEDIAFGQDQAFYQDALNGSVLVAMEDGFADFDELVDTYLIPVWNPTDTIQDVIKRYFPVTEDAEGHLLSISTPEFDTNPPTFNQHALSGSSSLSEKSLSCPESRVLAVFKGIFTPKQPLFRQKDRGSGLLRQPASWWNLYLSEGLDYNGEFKDTLAAPNTTLLVRILSDRDLDGYNDRNEIRLGTNPDDPSSHPNPELLAGYTVECSGDDCTVLLSLLNTGNYDAYGVEAVMYSPDDLSEITNNVIGGSGRVPAGEQVVVGSRVLQPGLGSWSGDSEPYSTGYYLGGSDRTYTFTAQSDGGIGQANPLVFNWSDGQGGSGTVDFGSGYQAPLPQDIALGVQIGFQSGTVNAGDSFTVEALTPRDTFQYTKNDPGAVDPVIVVSYNDPQGNHRFILPAASSLGTHDHLGDDLSGLSNQMIPDPGVQIASTSSTQANFVINAPHPESITNGHLFVEYIDSQGNVAHEDDFQRTFLTGPTVVPVTIDLNTYPADEYILLAFFTDSQGNIIDSSARPLASFGPDPLPIANITAAEWRIGPAAPQSVVSIPDPWDFGGVEAGTVLHARVTLGNTGVGNLLYALTGYGDELSFSGAAAGTLAPTQTRTIDITLDTRGLAAGPFSRTLKVRTNDPNHAEIVINLAGTIITPGGDATAYQASIFQPWDQYVYVEGPYNQNDTITFDHTILDEGARMHPLYLYDEDGETLRGVGEFGVDFSGGYAPAHVFGSGVDGDLVVEPTPSFVFCNHPAAPCTGLTVIASAGQQDLTVVDESSFSVGKEVLVIQMQGTGAGQYEFNTISAVNGNTLTLQSGLENTYTVDADSKVQVIGVPHWRNVTIQSGSTFTVVDWDGTRGGIAVFRVQETLTVEGTVNLDAKGFLGQTGSKGQQGSGTGGDSTVSSAPNGNGGGGGGNTGSSPPSVVAGGGGGGNASNGSDGGAQASAVLGLGGLESGTEVLSIITLGGAGGNGGGEASEAFVSPGGHGGGIAMIYTKDFDLNGAISADGTNGSSSGDHGGGGGGAGGSVLLVSQNIDIGNNQISVDNGTGGSGKDGVQGGAGSLGRIRIEYTNLSGTLHPNASMQQVNFYSLSSSISGSGVDGDLVVADGQTVYTDNTRAKLTATAASGQNQIVLDDATGFAVDREVLVIQIWGTGAGTYEFSTISDITGNTISLLYNLNNTYTVDSTSTVQVVQVPHYQNVTVESGGTLTAFYWGNHFTGGIVAFRASEDVVVEAGGSITVTDLGFLGGSAALGGPVAGNQGTSETGITPSRSRNPNGSAGGGGSESDGGSGGAGGGHSTVGLNGYGSGKGYAGNTWGTTPDLSIAGFGGSGGAGGNYNNPNRAGHGGAGGGLIMIMANSITVDSGGSISAKGGNGGNGNPGGDAGGGGGGAGGSVLLRAGIISLGTDMVTAVGGLGGAVAAGGKAGGGGGEGRIRVEYCQTLSGTSVPAASTEQIDCYIITHPGGSPNTELILPDDIAGGASELYILQYGQRSVDSTGGDQLFAARLPNTVYSSVNISALVERVTGSGASFNFCLDIGNDSVCDWTPPQQNFSGPARLDTNTTDAAALAAALNAYIAALGSGAADLLIPIRVNIDTPADIFLFDLAGTEGTALDLVPSTPTIAPQNGAAPDNIAEGTLVDLSATVTNNGSVPAENFTVAFYDGDPGGDGTLIGSYFVESVAAGATLPAQVVEWNTAGLLGDKTIYVFADASGAIFESDEDNNKQTAAATIKMKPDLTIESFSVPDARAGETVQADVTIGNDGEADVSGVIINLYLGDDPDTWTLVNNSAPVDVAEKETTSTQIAWTPPEAGAYTLSVMVDPTSPGKPDGDIVEADEDNNTTSTTAKAGWDVLTVDAGDDGTSDIPYNANAGYGWLDTEGTVVGTCGANPEQTYRQVGSAEELKYRFDNLLPERRYHLYLTFATCSGERWVNIYVDGRLTGEFFPSDLALANPVSFEPTHITNVPQTVAVLLHPEDYADDGTIDLMIENASGFGGPLVNIIDLMEIKYCYIDSGPDETPWIASNGCGYDPTVPSDGYNGWGDLPEETLRYSEAGLVVYKFSGLDPTRDYNFKVTFYEEDQLGREQLVSFDTILSETITLGPNPEYYAIQVPAAAYLDGEVLVAIERLSPVLAAGIVSEVTLEQIARRYAGVPPEPQPTPTPTPTTEPEPVIPEVELKKFNALWSADHVEIAWSTKTEIDNAAFIIYRSTDGLAWTEIHTEPSTRPCGNFTGTTPVEYSYSDYGVTEIGTYYYRLQYSGEGCGAGAGASMSAYMTPAELSPSFIDVPFDHPRWAFVEALWDGDYTAGCSTTSPEYCPEIDLNRAMSAVFMLRGNFGTDYVSPSGPWDSFGDYWLPDLEHEDQADYSWAEKWAEGMWEAGLTAGCQAPGDPLMYCPRRILPRVEASVFGLRMKHGVDYQPPAATGTLFADMTDPTYWGTKWAEQAYKDGLLPECGWQDGKPLFCPDEELDRSWAAYLIVIAKDLPMINLEKTP